MYLSEADCIWSIVSIFIKMKQIWPLSTVVRAYLFQWTPSRLSSYQTTSFYPQPILPFWLYFTDPDIVNCHDRCDTVPVKVQQMALVSQSSTSLNSTTVYRWHLVSKGTVLRRFKAANEWTGFYFYSTAQTSPLKRQMGVCCLWPL